MALIYDGNTIETSGHVDYSSHDLDRVVWNDPAMGSHVVWEREHDTWKGLKFVANNGRATMQWNNYERINRKEIFYSVDFGTSWHSIVSGSYDSIPFYEMWVKGDNESYYGSYDSPNKFSFTGSVSVSGNIMSLINSTNFETLTTLNGSFYEMFAGCRTITNAPDLPATTLYQGCYEEMFAGCTSLLVPPELPATTLTNCCYYEMFDGCTSLVSTPNLAATTLEGYCYENMFRGCTSLTIVSALPADHVLRGSYYGMFERCTSLVYPPEILATIVDGDDDDEASLERMFYGCISLVVGPTLHANILTDYCYAHMFYGCTNLRELTCYATNISSDSPTSSWLRNVSSTGDFYGYCSTPWTRDESGIPAGWNWHCLEPTFTLTFGSTGNGTVTATVDGVSVTSPAQVYSGATVVLTATPEAHHSFIRWSDGTSVNPYQFTMTQDTELYGEFDYAWKGLRFNANDGTAQMGWYSNSSTTYSIRTIQYSIDYGSTWVSLTSTTEPTMITFSEMWVKGDNVGYSGARFSFTGSVSANGNIMSLIDSTNFETLVELEDCVRGNFASMFQNCTSLTSAPILPATTLANYCYEQMFNNCTSLTSAPLLPATTLAERCYNGMFVYCLGLTTAPNLPAYVLSPYCYQSMFSSCYNLESANISAEIMASNSCRSMFWSCRSMKEIYCYARDISATDCTYDWLSGASQTGDFYGYCSTNWPRSISGIPTGWNWNCSEIPYIRIDSTIDVHGWYVEEAVDLTTGLELDVYQSQWGAYVYIPLGHNYKIQFWFPGTYTPRLIEGFEYNHSGKSGLSIGFINHNIPCGITFLSKSPLFESYTITGVRYHSAGTGKYITLGVE